MLLLVQIDTCGDGVEIPPFRRHGLDVDFGCLWSLRGVPAGVPQKGRLQDVDPRGELVILRGNRGRGDRLMQHFAHNKEHQLEWALEASRLVSHFWSKVIPFWANFPEDDGP